MNLLENFDELFGGVVSHFRFSKEIRDRASYRKVVQLELNLPIFGRLSNSGEFGPL